MSIGAQTGMGMGYLKGQSDLTSKNMLLIISHNEKIPGTKDCCECVFFGGKIRIHYLPGCSSSVQEEEHTNGHQVFFCFVLDTGYEK